MLKELEWMSFNEGCNIHTGSLISKTCNNLAPSYISDILTFSNNETHNLRSFLHNDIITPIHRTRVSGRL